jgi:hypothetical protein
MLVESSKQLITSVQPIVLSVLLGTSVGICEQCSKPPCILSCLMQATASFNGDGSVGQAHGQSQVSLHILLGYFKTSAELLVCYRRFDRAALW